MPSPFPGMDPYIETQEWADFHSRFVPAISDELTSAVGEGYVVRVERRVYFEHHLEDEDDQLFIADVGLTRRSSDSADSAQSGSEHAAPASAPTATIAPVEVVLPVPREQRESYLVVKDRQTREVITVIELLSPGNKRPGSDGRREYLAKRDAILETQTHLVELDLLRGGERLPSKTPLPPGDYYALLSRRRRRPRAEVYAWPLSHRLPEVPIPLREEDGDVPLDLQAVLDTTYQRARYDLSLDYTAPLTPPLAEAETAWAREVVERWQSSGRSGCA